MKTANLHVSSTNIWTIYFIARISVQTLGAVFDIQLIKTKYIARALLDYEKQKRSETHEYVCEFKERADSPL